MNLGMLFNLPFWFSYCRLSSMDRVVVGQVSIIRSYCNSFWSFGNIYSELFLPLAFVSSSHVSSRMPLGDTCSLHVRGTWQFSTSLPAPPICPALVSIHWLHQWTVLAETAASRVNVPMGGRQAMNNRHNNEVNYILSYKVIKIVI